MIAFMPYIWVTIIIVTLYVKNITSDTFTKWFIPSGIVALIMSLLPFDIAVWIQVLVFFLLALLLITLSTTIFKKSLKKQHSVRKN